MNSNGMEADKASDLLNIFAPLVYLYSGDALRPCGADWLLDRSALLAPGALETENPPATAIILQVGEVNPVSLISQRAGDTNSGWTLGQTQSTDFSLYLPEINHNGFTPNEPPIGSVAEGEPLSGGQCTAACYGHIRENADTYDLVYMFCYALNGATSKLPYAGVHVGDWEHITVRIAKDTHILQQVYYSRHDYGQGKWYLPTEIELQDGRIVVYAAEYSHASYPHAGDWPNPTVGALAPDKCDQGPSWKTWEQLINVGSLQTPAPGSEWIRFNGYWGGKNYDWSSFEIGIGTGPRTPSYQQWWIEEAS